MRVRKSPFTIALVLGFALLLTACGGSGGAPSVSIHVTLTDFAFSPNTFTIPAGAKISFMAVNNGAGEHSFVIMKAGHDVAGHFTSADQANVYWEKDHIAPGQTVSDTFTAPGDPGTYQVVCGVPGHFEAGMVARLIVVRGK